MKLVFVLSIFIYFYCKRANFSAALLHTSVVVLRKYPSVFFFNLGMFLLQSGVTYLFSAGALLTYGLSLSYWVYVYLIVSYFIISQTLSYFTYSTCAGVAASWYFLCETEYEVKHPMLFSLRNSLGPNFGPIALAGFLEGIAQGFRWLDKYGQSLTCGLTTCCICICRAICCCIFNCIRMFIFAMFGVSAREGVKRWCKISTKTLVKQVVNTSIIGGTFKIYGIGASMASVIIAMVISGNKYPSSSEEYKFLMAMAPVFAFSGLLLVSKPIEVISETIFVGFAEAPQRLTTGAHVVYDLFDEDSRKLMEKEISEMDKSEKGFCCC